MATGTVKWFNPTKGFGFISQDEAGKDVFVHSNELNGVYINAVSYTHLTLPTKA